MNNKISAVIVGTGSYVPDKILSNFDIEKIVDTSDEWIRTRTGIRERRIASDDIASSDLGTIAAKRAIEKAGISAQEVELIIVATVTPDKFFPSTASLIQKNLSLYNSGSFDIEAACAGFIYSLSIAKNYIEGGEYKTILAVGTETLSKIIDWKDRNTCVLFGDGAGAVVVKGIKKEHNAEGILATYLWSDGRMSDLLQIPAGGSRLPASFETINQKLHYLKMENGNEVFKSAIKIMEEGIFKILEKCNLTPDDIDLFIPHQANYRIISALSKRLELTNEKVFINVDKYGNTSAASIPMALDEAIKSGRVKDGSKVLMVAFGAGLTMASAIIKF